MEIQLYAKMFDLLTSAIQDARPEVFGAHTKGYKDLLPTPWSYNTPLSSISVPGNSTTVDYDARGNNLRCRMTPGKLTLTLSVDAFIKRTGSGLLDSNKISEEISIAGGFQKKADGKPPKYVVVLNECLLQKTQPEGIRELVSWIVAGALSEALSDTGLPARIELIKSKLTLQLSKPQLETERLVIIGTLENKK